MIRLLKYSLHINITIMKKVLFYTLLFFALINIAGCQKSIDPTGDLVINARDGVGTSLIGKTVYLYDNQYDFDNFFILIPRLPTTADKSGSNFYRLVFIISNVILRTITERWLLFQVLVMSSRAMKRPLL